MSYGSLEEVSTALRTAVPVAALFSSVNTRLIIQVGVNLKNIDPKKNRDRLAVEAALTAIDKMGIKLGGAR